jgi:molybdopterin-guanine dinucleotide biosynthesis protein A
MIAHVLRRLSPQVEGAWISTGAGTLALEALPEDLRGLPCLPDGEPRFRGPLAGLAAGLAALAEQAAQHAGSGPEPEWLQLAPCDAPFLAGDLVERLLTAPRETAAAGEIMVIVPRADGHLQPTFAAWHVSAREAVQSALAKRGGAGLLDVLRQLPHRVVDWPDTTPPAFFNVNTREDLVQAADWLQSRVDGATG